MSGVLHKGGRSILRVEVAADGVATHVGEEGWVRPAAEVRREIAAWTRALRRALKAAPRGTVDRIEVTIERTPGAATVGLLVACRAAPGAPLVLLRTSATR